MTGRVQLVQSVVQGMVIYTMIYKWPISLLYELQMSINNFVWTGDLHKRVVVTTDWMKLCHLKEEKGLGIRCLWEFNDAAMAKLVWEFLKSKKGWSRFMKARHYRKEEPIQYYRNSSIWKGIKEGIQNIPQDTVWCIGSKPECLFWRTAGWKGVWFLVFKYVWSYIIQETIRWAIFLKMQPGCYLINSRSNFHWLLLRLWRQLSQLKIRKTGWSGQCPVMPKWRWKKPITATDSMELERNGTSIYGRPFFHRKCRYFCGNYCITELRQQTICWNGKCRCKGCV